MQQWSLPYQTIKIVHVHTKHTEVIHARVSYPETVASLTLLHSEWPKLHRVLAVLSAIGLINNTKSLKKDLSNFKQCRCNVTVPAANNNFKILGVVLAGQNAILL